MARLTRWEHDGLTFDVRDTGPLDGPAVVCLHGFPQDGTAYDEVSAGLVAAGMRVLVPDQRGYSPGARPTGTAAYQLSNLTGDVVSLLDAAGVDAAHVVGHDWGGAVAWAVGGRHPDRVHSLVVLSTPHPRALRAVALTSSQAVRSSYMAFFQLPFAPELLLTAGGGAVVRRVLAAGGLSRERAAHYAARLQEPGAARAVLAWYRALRLPGTGSAGRVQVPTTYLVGTRDPFFSGSAVRRTVESVPGELEVRHLDAGHWLPEDQPAAVVEAVRRQVRAA